MFLLMGTNFLPDLMPSLKKMNPANSNFSNI